MNHSDLVDATAEVISARLNGSSLRRMAVDLYGDTARAGLLADVRNHRFEHVSHATLHDLRRRLGLSYDVRYVVDVPADHDAAVHLHPGGNGSLHTYTVPADAEVVIVPAGARVVQPKPPSTKPRRKRDRMEATRYTERGFTPTEIAEVVREVFDNGRIPSWLFGHPGMAETVERRAKLLARQTAQDAGTDPGEVAAVLTRAG